MPTTPSRLIQTAVRHSVFLEGYKTHEAAEFEPFLQRMAETVRQQLAGKELTEFKRDRLVKLQNKLAESLREIYDEYRLSWDENLIDLAVEEARFSVSALREVVDYDFTLPTRTQLRTAVFSTPLSVEGIDQGKLLAPFYQEWTQKTITRVNGTINAGVFQGLTTTDITRRVLGTKGANFNDGVFATAWRDAEMMTRTAVAAASSASRLQTYEANSDIVVGYRIVATLDGRTSSECRSMDGREFKTGKGPMPPFHINCRTGTVPVLNEKFKLLREGATRSARGEDGVEQVPAKQTYYEWLKQQPREFVTEVLGPNRAKLLLDGKISGERFAELNLGRNFKPLTLAEMRELDPVVFNRSGVAWGENG